LAGLGAGIALAAVRMAGVRNVSRKDYASAASAERQLRSRLTRT